RADTGALVIAAARFRRRRVRTCATQRAVKIDSRDDRFFEGHRILRALFIALLLQRATQNLPFDAARNGSLAVWERGFAPFGGAQPRPHTSILWIHGVIAEQQFFRSATHLSCCRRSNLLLHFFRRTQ